MTHPCTLVWELAGKPAPAAASVAKHLTDTPALCAMTGEHVNQSAPIRQALGTNFPAGTFRHPSDRVGPAALWCCSGKPPATLRMWTIVAIPGADLPPSSEKAFLQGRPGLYLGARGDLTGTLVAETLAHPPAGEWLVSVAESGQKHVLPYATVNHGPAQWTVRMETTDITATPDEWRTVHDTARALRRLGVPADGVRAGEPWALKTYTAIDQWRDLNTTLTPYLGSPVLDLALWTLTKGTIE